MGYIIGWQNPSGLRTALPLAKFICLDASTTKATNLPEMMTDCKFAHRDSRQKPLMCYKTTLNLNFLRGEVGEHVFHNLIALKRK